MFNIAKLINDELSSIASKPTTINKARQKFISYELTTKKVLYTENTNKNGP